MDRYIEALLLGTRWLLLPLYLALIATVLAIYVSVGQQIVHLALGISAISETELVLMILSVLDLVLVANLVIMVAVSSFESFISKIDVAEDADKPEWLGKLDSGNVKTKVAVSIIMISAIQLLRAFMTDTPADRLGILAGVHIAFVLSALALAVIDRLGRVAGQHH